MGFGGRFWVFLFFRKKARLTAYTARKQDGLSDQERTLELERLCGAGSCFFRETVPR
jgi:hypothetical protein